METVFHEQHKEVKRREGATGVFLLWWETIAGIFRTAPAEHLAMFRQDSRFALRMMRKIGGMSKTRRSLAEGMSLLHRGKPASATRASARG